MCAWVCFRSWVHRACAGRLLEEGDVAAVDVRKDEVEEKQRERRKELVKQGEEHMPRFFR